MRSWQHTVEDLSSPPMIYWDTPTTTPIQPRLFPTPRRENEKQVAEHEIQQLRKEVHKLTRSLMEQKQQIELEDSLYDDLIHKLEGIQKESQFEGVNNGTFRVALGEVVKKFGAPRKQEPNMKISSAFHEPMNRSNSPLKERPISPKDEKIPSYGPQQHSRNVQHNNSQFNGKNRDRYCKPCRLINNVSKTPFRTVTVSVQKQYTMSKKETLGMSKEDKERLVTVPVRIMGSPNPNTLYFVAKDVCLLIHTRKGNVAKSIGQFDEHEKARMPVLCPRSNGTVSTHILTVLSVKGVKRLLNSSRSSRAPHVLKWILNQVENICVD